MPDWISTMKPCRLCGGLPRCEVAEEYDPEWKLLEITECSQCGAATDGFETRAQADAAWNAGQSRPAGQALPE